MIEGSEIIEGCALIPPTDPTIKINPATKNINPLNSPIFMFIINKIYKLFFDICQHRPC